jgi:hypothetical protein
MNDIARPLVPDKSEIDEGLLKFWCKGWDRSSLDDGIPEDYTAGDPTESWGGDTWNDTRIAPARDRAGNGADRGTSAPVSDAAPPAERAMADQAEAPQPGPDGPADELVASVAPAPGNGADPPPPLSQRFDVAAGQGEAPAAGAQTKTIVPEPGTIVPLGPDAEREFMTRVVPWPKKGEPGWIQLWWMKPNPDNPKKSFWRGHSVRAIDAFFQWRQWGLVNFPHSFFCTGLQREPFKKGTERTWRSNKNTSLRNSLHSDIDVKAEKGYATIEEAIVAVYEFCAKTGIPLPNAWVRSGGGLHVYWIGNRDLTVEQWQPYAEGLKAYAQEHGLKADHGCTAVPSHVLRIPGTINSKANQRRPVYLFALGSKDFDFATELAMLPEKKPVRTKGASKTPKIEAPKEFLADYDGPRSATASRPTTTHRCCWSRWRSVARSSRPRCSPAARIFASHCGA